MTSNFFILALAFLVQLPDAHCYKPVVIIHGILDTAESLHDLKSLIEEAHPSTNVTVIKLYPDAQSVLTPMWEQVHGVSIVLEEIMMHCKDGIHLIGFSQGILCVYQLH